jgi:hypothetical protein
LVLQRHVVAGEFDHAGAEVAVQIVQRCLHKSPVAVSLRPSAGPTDPPLSRNLRDSGGVCLPLTPSVRRMPAGFPECALPPAVLLPERFRGPVAPSAAREKKTLALSC